jgi:hypothetical protein
LPYILYCVPFFAGSDKYISYVFFAPYAAAASGMPSAQLMYQDVQIQCSFEGVFVARTKLTLILR